MLIGGGNRDKGARKARSRAPRTRPLVLALALGLFLVQLATAFAGAAGPARTPGLDGDRITVCTGSGLKVFRIDADGNYVPVEEEDRSFAAGLCGSLAVAGLAGLEGTDAVLVPWPVPQHEVVAEYLPAAHAAPESAPPPGRAPPRSV